MRQIARLGFRLAAGALLASLAAPLGAQGPASTGVNLDLNNRDLSWDVAVGAGGFVDAFLVLSPPSPPWAANTAETSAARPRATP